jgi:hypothetical protein
MRFPTAIILCSVEVTVIDKDGRRHAIRGVAGQNLAELLAAHVDTLGDDAVARSPEGRGAVEAHVKVPNEMFIKAPAPAGDDIAFLSELAGTGTIDAHSRLASRIVLDKDMQGSLVALAELNPWKTL